MVNKKFEKKLFDHTSSESDNENQVVINTEEMSF